MSVLVLSSKTGGGHEMRAQAFKIFARAPTLILSFIDH